MSEQLTLEGVALDKKDKSELQSIVQALGGKPSARARKSDLIDQILELSGVTAASASTVTEQPTESTPTDGEDVAAPGAETAAPHQDSAEAEGDAEAAGRQQDREQVQRSDRGRGEGDQRGRPDRDRNGPRQQTRGDRPDRDEDSGRRPDGANRQGDDRNGARPAPGPQRNETGEQRRERDDAGRDRQRGEHGRNREDRPEGRNREDRAEARDRGERPDGGQRRGNQDEVERNGDNGDTDRDNGARGDDAEGSRRRRRRGRDRDRDRDREESQAEPIPVEGYLDLRDEGYGFLRIQGYLPSRDDVYVSVKHVRQHGLRRGDFVTGSSRPAARNEKNPALHQVDAVNGRPVDELGQRPRFEDLTPLFPDERLRLETRGEPQNMTSRIIDLVSPIGKGQRGLIVSPPKAGKTTVMKQIARAIEMNNPEVELIVLLVDERPEEVTDMKRWLQRGSVVASTFDRPSEEHCAVAELTIERAKRRVEEGKDVVIILDGITRLARAYNLAAPGTGRIMSGGVDSGALYPPKKFFGAARNLEEGGSLTILATALVDTGSKMDEVIFEEFKGTGNMELRLDRRMAEKRIFPAIDVAASSTRHEELLFERKQVNLVYKLRRVLSGVGGGDDSHPAAATELLIDRLGSFRSNDEFLAEIAKSPV